MRLSDVKGDRVFDVISAVIGPLCSIAQDREVRDVFVKVKAVPEGVDVNEFAVSRIKDAIPRLLTTHKADIVCILAAIEGVTPEAYSESLTMAKVVKDVFELLTDEDILSFLA